MCLSSEIVLLMYLYHLKEHDRCVCIISKYISIIHKIGCVKNSTTVGHCNSPQEICFCNTYVYSISTKFLQLKYV